MSAESRSSSSQSSRTRLVWQEHCGEKKVPCCVGFSGPYVLKQSLWFLSLEFAFCISFKNSWRRWAQKNSLQNYFTLNSLQNNFTAILWNRLEVVRGTVFESWWTVCCGSFGRIVDGKRFCWGKHQHNFVNTSSKLHFVVWIKKERRSRSLN